MVYHHLGYKQIVVPRQSLTNLRLLTTTKLQKFLKLSVLKKMLISRILVRQYLTSFGSPQMLVKNSRHKSFPTVTGFTWFAQHKFLNHPIRMFSLVFALALVLVYHPASAQTNLGSINLPQAPQFPQGQDRVRATDGTECNRSTAPRKKYMDMGVVAGGAGGTGVENQYPYTYYPGMTPPPNNQYNRAGGSVYARIVINLDAENYNLDCGRLYELELERLRTELEQAKLMGVGKPVAK